MLRITSLRVVYKIVARRKKIAQKGCIFASQLK